MMKATETKLRRCFILEPQLFEDSRGYFFESFNQDRFNTLTGNTTSFVQDNESKSSKGVLRGLHYQLGDYAQAKLIRVVKGKVLDVAVDLRRHSKTFGEHVSVLLTEQNKTQLFVPRGFAHGFLVLEDETVFNYKCDNYYAPDNQAGIIFNDKDLNIDWGFAEDTVILSQKDTDLPTFKNAIF